MKECFMSKFGNRKVDFLEGNIVKNLCIFALPIFAGEVLQNLYNSVDSLVVGRYVSDSALAAVSVCSNLTHLIIAIFNGLTIGNTVVIGQIYGKGERDNIDRHIKIIFSFSVLLGVILSILGIILSPALLRLTAAQDEVYSTAIVYLRIYLAGLMFTVIYNCGAGTLRAIGDSVSPFIILGISSAVNIALDFAFVKYFSMGVAGVGLATIIAQGMSAFMIHRAISKHTGSGATDYKGLFHGGFSIIWQVLQIGVPSSVNGAVLSVSNLVVWRYINAFSTAEVAGIGVAMRVDKFVTADIKAFGNAMTAYASQNIGASRTERVKKGMLVCLGLSVAGVAVISALVMGFSDQIISLFNTNTDVIAAGTAMIMAVCPTYACNAAREVLQGTLRGNRDTLIPSILSLAGMVGVRQLYLLWASQKNMGIRMIHVAYPIAWISTFLFISIYYLIVRKNIFRKQQ